jgi:hypothetical protein
MPLNTRQRRRESEDYRASLARFLWLSGVSPEDLDAVRADLVAWTAADSPIAQQLDALLENRPPFLHEWDIFDRCVWHMWRAEQGDGKPHSVSNLRKLLVTGSVQLRDTIKALVDSKLIGQAHARAPYVLTDAGRARAIEVNLMAETTCVD